MDRADTRSSIELLTQEHEQVRQAYARFEEMNHRNRSAVSRLVDEVCSTIETHAVLEEEVFFPAVRAALGGEEVMHRAEMEHDFAKALIGRLRGMTPADRRYLPTFTALCEYFVHHAKEEETGIFPKVSSLGLDTPALADKLAARKLALERRG